MSKQMLIGEDSVICEQKPDWVKQAIRMPRWQGRLTFEDSGAVKRHVILCEPSPRDAGPFKNKLYEKMNSQTMKY